MTADTLHGEAAVPMAGRVITRHALVTRLTHWVNAVCLLFLLLSGLQIFNAHPALYFGNQSNFADPAFALTAMRAPDGGIEGRTIIGGASFDTTGFLGASRTGAGEIAPRGFPSWLTIPSYQDLATGRAWHFFFAWALVINLLLYLLAGLLNGHLRRDLAPSGSELKGIGHSVLEHLRFRIVHDGRYNVLQKLSYIGVIFVLLPLMVATGLAMSPAMNAWAPWLPELFGGRQSARAVHFIVMVLLVLFFIVHIAMVVLAGPINEMRSILTGRYRIDADAAEKEPWNASR